MYYIYDDNPNIGFVSVENSIGTYVKSGYSAGKTKKQFTGAYSNAKYSKINSENIIDSHFKVRKTPSKFTIPAAVDTGRIGAQEAGTNKAHRIVEEYRNTEAPKQWQPKPQHQHMVTASQKDEQITKIPNKTAVRGDYDAKAKEAASHIQPSNNQQFPPIRPRSVTPEYSNSMKQRNRDAGSRQINQELGRSQRSQDVARSQRQKDVGLERGQNKDNKPAYVNGQMNMRKAQISTDPQKQILINNKRQISSLTVHTGQDKRQRLPVSMMMDKTLYKANGNAHDHNMQVISSILDDMTRNLVDRRHKGEYVNREIEKHLDEIYEKSKRSVVADNMKKFIGKDKIGKDLPNHNKQNTARIGNHEESLEVDGTPYAVFYRMNPETLDRQEGFMATGSMEDNRSSEVFSNENRPHTAFEEGTENMTNIRKTLKNGNTHQRKKVKNFSNYRNH